jgi:glutamate carboxypeptidase
MVQYDNIHVIAQLALLAIKDYRPMPLTHLTYSQRYLPLLQSYQAEFVQRLELLTNIDSGTTQVEGINQIMDYLELWFQELSFEVSRYPSPGFGDNLVARRRGRGARRILLMGHVDTVYPPGSAALQPFTIKDGVAYGPGVIDMKSGVVMCLHSLRALLESGFEEYQELCVTFNNDEEVGSIASSSLLREIAQQADAALVLESSRAAEVLTLARKGADKYLLEVRGVSAHSGAEPQKGRSAVIELAHKMISIHTLNTLFYGVTFNVTRISSSEVLNMVPDSASCHISVRGPSIRALEQAESALLQVTAGRNIPDTQTTLTRSPGRRPYEATPGILQLLAAAQQEGEALDIKIVGTAKGGVSDANLCMEVGTPALDSLGPIGGGMHNLQREYLQLASVPLRGALLAGLIQHLAERTG